ncbi:MAG: hypothetical protein ACFFD4_29480 [Candidatus Odinarchaeota archaeon]
MPRLVKGGKYVFGWSRIGNDGNILIPEEALDEYRFSANQKVILLNGSQKSGGIGITSPERLKNTVLASFLGDIPEIEHFEVPEGKIARKKGRSFCWTAITADNRIVLSEQALQEYSINLGDLLLAVRGSHVALGLIAKGPIYEEAKNHPELIIFE